MINILRSALAALLLLGLGGPLMGQNALSIRGGMNLNGLLGSPLTPADSLLSPRFGLSLSLGYEVPLSAGLSLEPRLAAVSRRFSRSDATQEGIPWLFGITRTTTQYVQIYYLDMGINLKHHFRINKRKVSCFIGPYASLAQMGYEVTGEKSRLNFVVLIFPSEEQYTTESFRDIESQGYNKLDWGLQLGASTSFLNERIELFFSYDRGFVDVLQNTVGMQTQHTFSLGLGYRFFSKAKG